MLMFGDRERHRWRKRIGRIHGPPAVVANECQPASPVAPDFAHDPAFGDDKRKLNHVRFCLAASAKASMSAVPVSSLDGKRRGPGLIVNGRSRAARVRRAKLNSARDLPRLMATTRCRPTPAFRASSFWLSFSLRRLSRMVRPRSSGVRVCVMAPMSSSDDKMEMSAIGRSCECACPRTNRQELPNLASLHSCPTPSHTPRHHRIPRSHSTGPTKREPLKRSQQSAGCCE